MHHSIIIITQVIIVFHFSLPDDVQEAYNLIQDLVPTTPQVILSFIWYETSCSGCKR